MQTRVQDQSSKSIAAQIKVTAISISEAIEKARIACHAATAIKSEAHRIDANRAFSFVRAKLDEALLWLSAASVAVDDGEVADEAESLEEPRAVP